MVLSKVGWAQRVRLPCIVLIASALAALAIPARCHARRGEDAGEHLLFLWQMPSREDDRRDAALVGVEESITASHYDDCSKDRYNPCGLTSSGERFHPIVPTTPRAPSIPTARSCSCGAPTTSARSSCASTTPAPTGATASSICRAPPPRSSASRATASPRCKVRVIKAPEAGRDELRPQPQLPSGCRATSASTPASMTRSAAWPWCWRSRRRPARRSLL